MSVNISAFCARRRASSIKIPVESGTCSATGGHPFLRIDRHHRYFGSYARLLYPHRFDCQPAAQKGPAALARGFVPADFLPAADSIAHDGENVSPLIFDSLGVYFSLICVPSLLIYTVEKVQLQSRHRRSAFALRQWLGATLVAFVCGAIRELSATGSLWGFPFCKIRPASLLRRWPWEDFCSLAFCRLLPAGPPRRPVFYHESRRERRTSICTAGR